MQVNSHNGEYKRRAIDDLLDEFLPYLPAIAIEGAKGVGKTETAKQRVTKVWEVDDSASAPLALASLSSPLDADESILFDEWQHEPQIWNKIRRAVDNGAHPGSFLLTGSAAPLDVERLHTGAGRIDSIRMRPFTLAERGIVEPVLLIDDLLQGRKPILPPGEIEIGIADYAREICASGLPEVASLPPRIRNNRLDSYIQRIVSKEFPAQGVQVRQPTLVLAWLRAYAAATSTTASYNELLDAATAGDGEKPSRSSSQVYRDLLEQLMIVEPLHAWLPIGLTLATLAKAPKHHLCDPALAARLLNYTEHQLIDGTPQSSNLFSQLFESLAVLTARVAAEVAGAQVYHLRTRRGDHEVDIIVEGPNGTVVAIEVKTSAIIRDDDVKHLNWLKEKHNRPVERIIVHAGTQHYQREDGIYVVPLVGLA